MDCVPYPVHQSHMYRKHDLQHQEKQQLHQQQQNQKLCKSQPQHQRKPLNSNQSSNLPPKRRQLPPVWQLSGRNGRGRGGQYRAVIVPIFSQTNIDGSVDVRIAHIPTNNGDNNNNNNSDSNGHKAPDNATRFSKATQLALAAGGLSKQTDTAKGVIRFPDTDYNNVLGAVPRLGRVLGEEGGLGCTLEQGSRGRGGERKMVEKPVEIQEERGCRTGQEQAIDRREETLRIGPPSHTTATSSAAGLSGPARSTGCRRGEAAVAPWDSSEPGGKEEEGGGEHCSRALHSLSVRSDGCSARETRHSSGVGKICSGRGGGGGGGGWRSEEGVTATAPTFNTTGDHSVRLRAGGDDGSGADSQGDRRQSGDKDDVTLEKGAAVGGTVSLNAAAEARISPNSAIEGRRDSDTEYFSHNRTGDRVRDDATGAAVTATHSNGSIDLAGCKKSDKFDGGACNTCSQNSANIRTEVPNMGNQSSSARVSSSGSDARPRKISFRDKKAQSPSSTVDATVHFKKDNAFTAGSDGGSVSIVSETRQPETPVVNPVNGSRGHGSDTAAIRDEAGTKILNDLNKESPNSKNAHKDTKPSLQSNIAVKNTRTNVLSKEEETERNDVKENDRLSVASSTSTVTSDGSQISPIDPLKRDQEAPKLPHNQPQKNTTTITPPTVSLVGSTGGQRTTGNANIGCTTAAAAAQLGEVARPVKLGPKTEDIYAVPVPRRLRAPTRANLVRQRDVDEEEEEELPDTGPPPIPERPSEEAGPITRQQIQGSNNSNTLENVEAEAAARQPNIVQVTCQMKKSHTTCGSLCRAASSRDSLGECYSFRGYYFASAAAAPSYDYFSLGRKPKRVPLVKTLTDSSGMAMSLDKLLKLRRQSPSTPSNSSVQLSQEPSVEDILRSCSEYDMSVPSEPVFRDRTSSDADATRSPLDRPAYPRGPLLSFTEASQIKLPDDWEGFGQTQNGGSRHGFSKPFARGTRNSKRQRSSAREARSKPSSGATVQKSDSVRSAPPAPEERQNILLTQKTRESYIQASTEISFAPPAELRVVKKSETHSNRPIPPSLSSSSTSTLSSLSSHDVRTNQTHSTPPTKLHKHGKADGEQPYSKENDQSSDSVRLRETTSKGNVREASFTSSSSSHSSSTSTATVVASDQLASTSKSHSTSYAAAAAAAACVQQAAQLDTASVDQSCRDYTLRGSPDSNTDTARGNTAVNSSKPRPADSALIPTGGEESEANNGRNLPSSLQPITTSSSGGPDVPTKLHKVSRDEKSRSKQKCSPLAQDQKSLSTDSATSNSSSVLGTKKRKMEREEPKLQGKQKEGKAPDKKSYSLKWLKPSEKSSKTKSNKKTPSLSATLEEPRIHLSITSEPEARSSSSTTSDSLTSDPRSRLTSGGSLDEPRSPVFSPPPSGAEMSALTVDISPPGGFFSRDSGRSSPFLPAPRSPNQASKLEAYEALTWLRAAGFPQYSQMFEDGQFPLELSFVEKDHDFLDTDSLHSLFRRLETLNKYAGMKLDSHPRKKTASEEEEEEDFCALSERWEYQKSVRRWSRKDLQPPCSPAAAARPEGGSGFTSSTADTGGQQQQQNSQPSQRAASHDSLLADQEDSAQPDSTDQPESGDGQGDQVKNEDEDNPSERHTSSSSSTSSTLSPRLRRAASERIKTAKSLWRKMEGGLKSRKSRRHQIGHGGHRGGSGPVLEISDPVLADRAGDMQARLVRLQCVDIKQGEGQQGEIPPADPMSSRLAPASQTELVSSKSCGTKPQASSLSTPSSPHPDAGSPGSNLTQPAFRSRSLDSASTTSQAQPSSVPDSQTKASSGAPLSEYYSAQSQLQQNLRQAQQKTSSSDGLGNLLEIFLLPQDHQPGRFPTALQNGYIEKDPLLSPASTGAGNYPSQPGGNFVPFPDDSQTGATPHDSAPGGATSVNANRTSVYDNFGLPNSKTPDNRILNPQFSPIKETSSESSPVSRSGRAMSAEDAGHSLSEALPTPKDRSVSLDAASRRGMNSSHSSSSIRNRSVSFESSSSLGDKEQDDSAFGATGSSELSPSRTEAYVASLPGKGVSHSVSADSYFRDSTSTTATSDTGSVSSTTSQEDGSTVSGSTLHYSNYEEFEAILKQLYDNISDLTNFIDWDDDETTSQSNATKGTTSPSATTALHVDTPSLLTSSERRARPRPGRDPNIDLDLEDLDSPLSRTSDPLALSPTASRGEAATDESLDLDQQENSSSSSGGDAGSHIADSGSDDAEPLLADLSHDDSLDTIPAVTRERRDSGVGHSLTRAPSDRRRKKIRWHSFQRSHRPDVTCRAKQVNALTVGQLVRLQKLALLKLTGIMEKCLPVNKSGWNWMMPRFMKRHKTPDFSDRTVFGVPLSVMVQRTGQPLPQSVLYAMRYLRRTSQASIGIFRKSGVKSKIQQLRDHLEAHPDMTDFEGLNTYNVADMLKTFFRDLPECLLTSKMSETFRSIYTHVPQSQRLEAMQAAILLLPDENREVLQSLLLFLSDISSHQEDHQMNASNLAVCFTPTVFQLGRSGSGSPASPKRGRKLGGSNSNPPGTPDPREIMEQKAAHECLHMLITECKTLFTVPAHLFRQLQVISLAHEEPGPLHDLGTSTEEVRAFGQERIQLVLKEAHDRKSHWHFMHSVGDVEVYNRKPMDDYPLKEWKLIVDIEAPPIEVLRRIMHERHAWDEDLLSWSVVERLDPHSDIFQYALNTMAPHPSRHYCVLRYWRSDLTKGSCALVTMSVEHADVGSVQGVWAIDLGSYFLMEPCGAGRSRLTYITRVDTRGRTPEWYTKMYGYIQANFLERLKDSFKQETSGPETKV